MKDEQTNLILRIPLNLKKMLDSCALEADLTTSQLVRGLIRDYVKKNYVGDLWQDEKPKKRGRPPQKNKHEV